MRVGFTGTHRGLTPVQRNVLRAELEHLHPRLFIHGACIGADDDADRIAVELGIERCVYPSTALTRVPNTELIWRSTPGAEQTGGSPITIHSALPPLVRDKLIVRDCDILLACPAEYTERLRSGTWATVRYARKAGKPVTIIGPGGIR